MCLNCLTEDMHEAIGEHLPSMATATPSSEDMMAAMAACGTVMSGLLAMVQGDKDREELLGRWLDVLRSTTAKKAAALDAEEAAEARAAGQMN